MAEKLSISSTVQRNENIVDAAIDGETVMLSIENGQYYGLNEIASRIWQLIEKPGQVNDICQSLQTEYKVSPDQCQLDVLNFLNNLNENNVITVNG